MQPLKVQRITSKLLPFISVLSFSELCSPEGFGLSLSRLFMKMIHGFGMLDLAWPGEFGARCPGSAGTRPGAPAHHIRSTLFLVPSEFPLPFCHLPDCHWPLPREYSWCFSLPLHGAVGSLCNLQGWRIPLLGSSMCSQLGISASKAPELIPVASDPSQPQERDAVHWELWSAARLEHQKIHGMSGILFNNKNTTAFSELSG